MGWPTAEFGIRNAARPPISDFGFRISDYPPAHIATTKARRHQEIRQAHPPTRKRRGAKAQSPPTPPSAQRRSPCRRITSPLHPFTLHPSRRAVCSLPRSRLRTRPSDTETVTETATETATVICHCPGHRSWLLSLSSGRGLGRGLGRGSHPVPLSSVIPDESKILTLSRLTFERREPERGYTRRGE